MPLYEYRCTDCQNAFERYVRSFGEAVTCDACESANVEKRLSTFAMASSPKGGVGPAMGGGGCCGGGGCGCH
jgi:putative FmdB family regulatory protein